MKPTLSNLFRKYVTVGVLNTALHWLVFFILIAWFSLTTAWANLFAFFVAVTFSFFVNASYTFRAAATGGRYLTFVIFMALLSYSTGWVVDRMQMPSVVALVAFSLISLLLGFCYSRYVVFREKGK